MPELRAPGSPDVGDLLWVVPLAVFVRPARTSCGRSDDEVPPPPQPDRCRPPCSPVRWSAPPPRCTRWPAAALRLRSAGRVRPRWRSWPPRPSGGRSPRCCCYWSARAWRTGCRLAPSAVALCSRRSSSAARSACCWRHCPAWGQCQPWPSVWAADTAAALRLRVFSILLVVLLLGPAAASQIPVIILSAVTAYVVAELLASRRTSRAAMQPAPGVTAES